MPEFKCRRCGRCCGIVPFNKTEYNAIRDIAKKMHISQPKVITMINERGLGFIIMLLLLFSWFWCGAIGYMYGRNRPLAPEPEQCLSVCVEQFEKYGC